MSFLRAESVICGTSTTGTGTLTLAACPSPPGGVDIFAAFQGQGLGTSQTIPTTYTIIEYTDSTFGTAKQMEKGVGALTIGASVTATTLARTTVQSTATSMNTSTPTYTTGAPSTISIGTAANVLVFVGASAADIMAWSPYFDTLGDNVGVIPAGWVMNTTVPGNFSLTTLVDQYTFFEWRIPMLVKRATVSVTTADAGTSNADARLYAINSSGRPGKLLYDFGLLGTANQSLIATGNISTSAAGSGFMLLPGEYFFDVIASFSNSPKLAQFTSTGTTSIFTGGSKIGGGGSKVNISATKATSGAIGAAPDPANVTGYVSNTDLGIWFALNAS